VSESNSVGTFGSEDCGKELGSGILEALERRKKRFPEGNIYHNI